MPPVSQPHCHPSNTQSSEDRRRYPSLVPQQNIPKNLITSHHIQQDHSTQNQFQVSRTISPASSQVHSRVGPESENKPFTATDSAFAASPCPESSPSPDDSQKLNACKHEPIQNIIGKHPPSDILYLICRLCRQTYGSPYCFRKHFRNQHGFEPKADHTIVQTISATKTAMAHTGSSDVTVSFVGSLDAGSENPAGSLDLAMTPTASSNVILGNMESFDSTGKPLRSVQMEKASNNDHSPHTQSVKSLAAGTTPAVSRERLESPLLCEETKLSIKKDSLGITKYLECPECGQSFQLNDFGSYKRHCRQHSLSRSSGPYACHECERSFSEPAHLQEHQATHSGFTPSVCAICHTLFSSANYLAEHLQTAHGVTCVSEGKQSLTPNDSASEPLRKSEPLALTDMSKLKRSSSFPDWSVMESPSSLRQTVGASASSHSATPSPSRHSTTPLAEPQMMIKCTSITQSASVNQPLIMPKLPRYSKTAENAYMLTVHTPKGLEIQKLPADAVVTTASPDSSYDEAKLFLDASQGGGTFQRDNQDFVRASNNLGEGSPGQDNKNSIIKQSRPNDNTGNVRYDNKEEMESNSSGRESLNGSRAPSPAGIEEEPFYKHKKYSLHRKRTNISEASSEPSAKSLKIEGNIVSVSSTGNSGVTVQDCESSSTRLEDSSLSWRMYTEEQVETDKITKHEQGDNYGQSKGNKSNINAGSDKPRECSKRYGPSEGGEQFKWDRQTRSQAGKIISQ
ncbi:unnamed protein product [Candidula unifasciata]|uniref:C2H2-type domain-containing protein n=1 Tax=Candidula unifasciata TaxID=100452 RepID=A0A8S3ZX24_9EUPU|nr:unnamed protein product [Candidula unifasciata]